MESSDVSKFFFSSRRRHTRWPRDWSSDVCSSDLGEGAGRRWTAAPGIVAAPGDAKYTAHHRSWIDSLVCSYELEDSGGSEPLSRANQAAAFLISLSLGGESCSHAEAASVPQPHCCLDHPSVRPLPAQPAPPSYG